jgi:hypothetical protein
MTFDPTSDKFDNAYRQEIFKAVAKAVMGASMADVYGKRMCVLRSAEIADALMIYTAFVVSTSAETNTPEGRKRVVAYYAEELAKMIESAREHGLPESFFTPGGFA